MRGLIIFVNNNHVDNYFKKKFGVYILWLVFKQSTQKVTLHPVMSSDIAVNRVPYPYFEKKRCLFADIIHLQVITTCLSSPRGYKKIMHTCNSAEHETLFANEYENVNKNLGTRSLTVSLYKGQTETKYFGTETMIRLADDSHEM